MKRITNVLPHILLVVLFYNVYKLDGWIAVIGCIVAGIVLYAIIYIVVVWRVKRSC